jgi:hypothetical protein
MVQNHQTLKKGTETIKKWLEGIMSEHQSDPVSARLDRLERENWYWKRATLLLLLVIGSVILMGQKQARQEPELLKKAIMIEAVSVIAQHIGIIDEEGKKRAEIYYKKERGTGGTVVFEMNATNTSTQAGLYVDDKGAMLHFMTPSKKSSLPIPTVEGKVVLSGSIDEGASFTLYDSQGDTHIELADQKGARAILGKTRLEIPATGSVEERSASSLVIFNKDRKVIWKAP